MINLIKKYCPGGMTTIVIAVLLRAVTSVLYTVNATISAQIIGNLGRGVVLKDCIALVLVTLGCVVGVLLTRILTAYTREGMTKNMQKDALSKSLRLKTSVLQDISIGDLKDRGRHPGYGNPYGMATNASNIYIGKPSCYNMDHYPYKLGVISGTWCFHDSLRNRVSYCQ